MSNSPKITRETVKAVQRLVDDKKSELNIRDAEIRDERVKTELSKRLKAVAKSRNPYETAQALGVETNFPTPNFYGDSTPELESPLSEMYRRIETLLMKDLANGKIKRPPTELKPYVLTIPTMKLRIARISPDLNTNENYKVRAEVPDRAEKLQKVIQRILDNHIFSTQPDLKSMMIEIRHTLDNY